MKVPIKYEQCSKFADDIAAVKYNGKWGYIDSSGHELIATIYGDGEYYGRDSRDFKDGFACVEQGGKYGLIDKKGNLIIPCQYTRPLNFINGLAKIEKIVRGLKRKGFVNIKGEEVLFKN